MTAPQTSKFERLLRWYPRAWREENGEFLLAVLEEDARERGKTKPTVADAWSMRAHGIAARATPRVTLGFAIATLVASLIPAVSIFVSYLIEPAWVRFAISGLQVFTIVFLPFVMVLSFGRLHSGRVGAPAALTSLALWMLHSAAAACASLSWSIGWDEANNNMLPGATTTWFGDSTFFWLAVAAALGTVSLSILFRGLLRWSRSSLEAWILSGIISVGCLIPLFISSVLPSILPLAAGVFLVLSAIDVSHQAAPTSAAGRAPRAARPVRSPERASRSGLIAVLILAVATAVAGAFCVALSLGGSTWSSAFRDSTHSMNVGLGLGCLAAVPLVAASSWMLARRFGPRGLMGGAFFVAALLLESASQFVGAGHPVQQPLWALAALCIGAAAAVPLTGLVPASRPVSAILAIGGSLVLALTVGLGVPGLPFVAPLASLAVACWAAVRLILDARSSRASALSISHGGLEVANPH